VWVTIPAGEFWMGSSPDAPMAFEEERPAHRLFLPEFQIARTPVTNVQYLHYVAATGAKTPGDWEDGLPPKDKLNHPVVNVRWHDACAYCRWLSQETGKTIGLPSEAEWEKAARGDQDRRAYPWGDLFDMLECNSHEQDLGDTTPVGVFLDGASPYGCLDMAGNVWEWTHSLLGDYPYPGDAQGQAQREDLNASDDKARVLRGGAFDDGHRYVRCACRSGLGPYYRSRNFGFRVVVLPCR
jgi:formylglycine-generating enzyme required for sulfatase activity